MNNSLAAFLGIFTQDNQGFTAATSSNKPDYNGLSFDSFLARSLPKDLERTVYKYTGPEKSIQNPALSSAPEQKHVVTEKQQDNSFNHSLIQDNKDVIHSDKNIELSRKEITDLIRSGESLIINNNKPMVLNGQNGLPLDLKDITENNPAIPEGSNLITTSIPLIKEIQYSPSFTEKDINDIIDAGVINNDYDKYIEDILQSFKAVDLSINISDISANINPEGLNAGYKDRNDLQLELTIPAIKDIRDLNNTIIIPSKVVSIGAEDKENEQVSPLNGSLIIDIQNLIDILSSADQKGAGDKTLTEALSTNQNDNILGKSWIDGSSNNKEQLISILNDIKSKYVSTSFVSNNSDINTSDNTPFVGETGQFGILADEPEKEFDIITGRLVFKDPVVEEIRTDNKSDDIVQNTDDQKISVISDRFMEIIFSNEEEIVLDKISENESKQTFELSVRPDEIFDSFIQFLQIEENNKQNISQINTDDKTQTKFDFNIYISIEKDLPDIKDVPENDPVQINTSPVNKGNSYLSGQTITKENLSNIADNRHEYIPGQDLPIDLNENKYSGSVSDINSLQMSGKDIELNKVQVSFVFENELTPEQKFELVNSLKEVSSQQNDNGSLNKVNAFIESLPENIKSDLEQIKFEIKIPDNDKNVQNFKENLQSGYVGTEEDQGVKKDSITPKIIDNAENVKTHDKVMEYIKQENNLSRMFKVDLIQKDDVIQNSASSGNPVKDLSVNPGSEQVNFSMKEIEITEKELIFNVLRKPVFGKVEGTEPVSQQKTLSDNSEPFVLSSRQEDGSKISVSIDKTQLISIAENEELNKSDVKIPVTIITREGKSLSSLNISKEDLNYRIEDLGSEKKADTLVPKDVPNNSQIVSNEQISIRPEEIEMINRYLEDKPVILKIAIKQSSVEKPEISDDSKDIGVSKSELLNKNLADLSTAKKVLNDKTGFVNGEHEKQNEAGSNFIDSNQIPLRSNEEAKPENVVVNRLDITFEDNINAQHAGIKVQGVMVLNAENMNSQNRPANNDEPTLNQIIKDSINQDNEGSRLPNSDFDQAGKESNNSGNDPGKTLLSKIQIDTNPVVATQKEFVVKSFEDEKSDIHTPKDWDVKDLTGNIIKQAKLSLKNGFSEMNVQLVPPHLGRMKMKIQIENQQLVVRVQVESTEAKQLIQQSIHQLNESMAEHGVEVEKFDVFVQSEYQEMMNQYRRDNLNNSTENLKDNLSSSEKNENSAGEDDQENTKDRMFGYNTMELVA
ncbi:flagellar hook-length control protein FliK [candidate division KSB1 bacterium]